MEFRTLPYHELYLLVGVILACLLIYGIVLAIYRSTLHPLAAYPGRRLAAITQWYEFYYDVVKRPGGQYYFEVEKMHEKYGPIVRVTPDEVHIRDAEYHHILYAPGARRHKSPAMARMLGTPKSSFGTIDHDLHKLRRAPNRVMFSQKAIHGPIQKILCTEVDTFRGILNEMYRSKESRQARALYLGLASVFTSQYFIDCRLNYLDDEDALHQWFLAVEALTKGTPVLRQMPWLTEMTMNLPRWIQNALSPHLARTLALHDLMRSKAREFMKSPARAEESGKTTKKTELPKTIFHAIQRHPSLLEEKSFDRLWQEAFSLFVGGLDTTSRTMTAATYYLLAHPSHLRTLTQELDDAMPDPEVQPDYKSLERLPFLTAVIKETLRCMQLVTGRIPVICDEPMIYRHYTIPPGCTISMTITNILGDPTIFSSPEIFDPHRWLDFSGQLHSGLDRYFVAFGRGPRACVAQEAAWALLYRSLSGVFRRFDLKLYDFDYDRDFKMVSDCFFGDPGPDGRGVRINIVGIRK